MKALTFKQYRIINIIILAVVFAVVETIIAVGANVWFPGIPYTLSLAVIYISLEMMRWGWYGGVAAIVSGFAFCFGSGANSEQYVIYLVGNLVALLAVFLLKKVGFEKVRSNATYTAIYVLFVFLLLQIGRWAVAVAFGSDPLIFIQFITTDALSGFFGMVVVLVLRNAEGMFENQKQYLLRLEKERKAREEEQ